MIKWIKIDIMIEGSDKPPFFVGSMFRGALGVALKKLVCINPSYQCEECFAAKKCIYHVFYEEKNVFHPYRFDVNLQPNNYDFSLYLFEDAVDSLPYVLSAIRDSAEKQGFGKNRKIMKVRQMSISNKIVYDGKEFKPLAGIMKDILLIDKYYSNVEIEFIMPLRIKEHNKIAKEGIAFHTLINNIHHRYLQIRREAVGKLGYQVEGEIVFSSLKFVTMQRYSNRQKKGMEIGGLKGILKIRGIDQKSYVYLKIGEIIGAGKQTVFGLGSYILKEID